MERLCFLFWLFLADPYARQGHDMHTRCIVGPLLHCAKPERETFMAIRRLRPHDP